jgi:DNA-directed RNA polymerase
MQKADAVIHVIAEEIEDISGMLDVLVRGEGALA